MTYFLAYGNNSLWAGLRGPAENHRVVRGGSWNNNQNNARCAYRNRNNPNNRNNNQGFRVVVAHNFPLMPEMPVGYGQPAEALRDGAAWSLAAPDGPIRLAGQI